MESLEAFFTSFATYIYGITTQMEDRKGMFEVENLYQFR